MAFSHSFFRLPLLVALLAVAPVVAQPPTRSDPKPSATPKGAPVGIDPKVLADPKAGPAAAALLEAAYEGERPPEAVRMLAAILRGSSMGPNDGWFGPAESRFSFLSLVRRHGGDPARGGIPCERVRGPADLVARLDRDRNGVITPDDLDWSDRNPYIQMSYMVSRLYRKLNAKGDGKLTKDELQRFFDRAAGGKDHLSPDDFRDALLAGLFTARSAGSGDEGPTPAVLVRGLFSGEIGSMNEGPKLNDPAPDFTLPTFDGKGTIQLKKLLGPKPVVLVFGSFT